MIGVELEAHRAHEFTLVPRLHVQCAMAFAIRRTVLMPADHAINAMNGIEDAIRLILAGIVLSGVSVVHIALDAAMHQAFFRSACA